MCFLVIQLFNDQFSLFWSLSNKAGEGVKTKEEGHVSIQVESKVW